MVALLCALGALAACGSGPREIAHTDPSIPTATTYVVTGVTHDGKARALVPGSQIRLRFADEHLTVTAGCNTMNGAYRLEGSRLVVDGLATTDMGCALPLMQQDTWVGALFAKPSQLTTGAEAALISGSTVLALADRESVSPDLPLTGTHWVADTFLAGEVASSVPAGTSAWLQINGSELQFDAGCNSGTGTVQISGDELTFTDIVMTARPCPTGNPVYGTFATVLQSTATYKIEEHALTITRGQQGLGFRAVQAKR